MSHRHNRAWPMLRALIITSIVIALLAVLAFIVLLIQAVY